MPQNRKAFVVLHQEEANNFRATLQHFPKEHYFTDEMIGVYQSLPGNIHEYPRECVPVLQMYWLCFRSLLISMQLLFEAHIPESFAIASRAAESVAAARKMSLFPEKIPGWIQREKNTGQPFRRVLGKLFSENDSLLQPEIFNFYQTTSEHGRHTAFESTIFFSDFSEMVSKNKVHFTYSDIDDPTNLKRSINYFINIYIKFLYVFKDIFGKYLAKEWSVKLEKLNNDYIEYKKTLVQEFGYQQ